jgi:hypothetical protein
MSYTDSTKIENLLQRSLTTHEHGALSFMIPAIEKWIDNKIGSTFGLVAESTRYYDGGENSIDIDPCTAVTAVTLYATDGTESDAYTLNEQYVLEPQNEDVKREVVKRSGIFPRGSARIGVTAKFSEYNGGIPYDIQMVATRLAASFLRGSSNDASSGGIKSESVEGHSVSYALSSDEIGTLADADPFIKSVLSMRTEALVG